MGEVFSGPHPIRETANAGISPPADLVPVREGLASLNGETQAEDFPDPSGGGGASLFRALPAKGRWISIRPFLRGLLEYYGF